jgi:ATP-dependent Clp protease protease subunit
MNLGKEFRKYAVGHIGLPGTTVDAVNKHIVEASMTPYILEERQLNVTQMDVFSRLMMDRIIWVSGVVDEQMSIVTQAQLMFLDSLNHNDITLQISSPGGSVPSGLSLLNVMHYVTSDIATINMGTAASMGSILLSGGQKTKRFSLRDSRVMLHTVSSGASGLIADMQISLKEAEKYNETLFNYLSEFTGQKVEKLLNDTIRDKWFSAEEAKSYGLIDDIITKRKK